MSTNPPWLVLLPGLACDAAVWQPVVAALDGRARCWVPPAETHDDIGAMARAVLQQAPAARFALAGHSLGGRIALELWRQAPERVEAMALLDTGWQPRPPDAAGHAEAAQRQALVALARREGMRTMADSWAPPMLHPAQWGEPVHAAVLAMVAAQHVERFAAQQQALLSRPDATPLLPTLTVPTLVLCGEDDQWSPPERHREMAARIPGAQLVLVPQCGHMSPMEQPGAVAAALTAWLHGGAA